MATITIPAVKYPAVSVCQNRTQNGLLDQAVDCREVNAVTVQVLVNGSAASASIQVLGSSAEGGNYILLPDTNATRTVTADTSFDVIVGTAFVKVQISSISGTFLNGQGYTILVTPYVSAGSARVAASISVDTLAAIQANTGALNVSGASTIGTDGSLSSGQTAYDTGTGFWIEYNAGTPRLSLGNSAGNKLTWDGSSLTITGSISATTGAIGGWTVGATSLTAGSGASTVGLDSGGSNPAIYAGSATPGSAPFRVTQAGALTATNATITGTVTASAGTIGGWTLGATSLTAGSGANTVGIDSSGTNPAFYAGSATPASAPFRVTQAGALTASSATISGAITTGAGSSVDGQYIVVASVTTTQIAAATITATNIAAGTITATEIAASTITSDKLSVSQLSAIAADMGTITAGTVTGATVRTAATGARVVMDTTGIKWYDATTQRGQILSDGSGWLGASGSFSWTTAGVVSIDGARISAGTITGTQITASNLVLGTTGVGQSNVFVDSNNVYLRTATTAFLTLNVSGIEIGPSAAGQSNIAITSNSLLLRNGTNTKIELNTSGSSSFLGAFVVGTAGSISSGQTAYDTGTGFWLDYNAGTPRFSIGNAAGNKLTWNGTTLAVTGTITASAGTIGSFTIGTYLYTGSKTAYNDTNAGVHLGSDGIGIGNNVFTVSSAGALVATSATITGAITATSGSIGSFTIGTYLYTGTKTAYNDANAGVHIGSDGIGIGNNVFTVSSAGALVATSATITGAVTATSGSIGSFTIGTYLYTGTKTAYNDANAGVHFGSDGIGIGNNVFTVSSAGALVAISATITGTITVSSGSFTGVMSIGTAGGIYQGTGTFATPTTGLKIWNDSGVGRIGGYNGGTIQWYCATDGKVYAGAGSVTLDATGVVIFADNEAVSAPSEPTKLKWDNSGTAYASIWGSFYESGGTNQGGYLTLKADRYGTSTNSIVYIIADTLEVDAACTIGSLAGYIKGTAGALSAVASIPNTDITGLGTISTQAANSVAITGGSITGLTALAQTSGIFYVNEDANSGMTTGITVNQGGADNEIVALKSSDVAHAITGIAETDTFALLTKVGATNGGVQLKGLTNATIGLILQGIGVTDDTTKSTAGAAYIRLDAIKRSGSAAGDVGADGNLVAITNNGTTRFIFDAEGDSHEDGTGWTAYDDHDDLALLDLVNETMLRAQDPIKQEFWAWVAEHARKLQDLKIISFNADGHHFINRSKMQELHTGALRQIGRRFADLESRLALAAA